MIHAFQFIHTQWVEITRLETISSIQSLASNRHYSNLHGNSPYRHQYSVEKSEMNKKKWKTWIHYLWLKFAFHLRQSSQSDELISILLILFMYRILFNILVKHKNTFDPISMMVFCVFTRQRWWHWWWYCRCYIMNEVKNKHGGGKSSMRLQWTHRSVHAKGWKRHHPRFNIEIGSQVTSIRISFTMKMPSHSHMVFIANWWVFVCGFGRLARRLN